MAVTRFSALKLTATPTKVDCKDDKENPGEIKIVFNCAAKADASGATYTAELVEKGGKIIHRFTDKGSSSGNENRGTTFKTTLKCDGDCKISGMIGEKDDREVASAKNNPAEIFARVTDVDDEDTTKRTKPAIMLTCDGGSKLFETGAHGGDFLFGPVSLHLPAGALAHESQLIIACNPDDPDEQGYDRDIASDVRFVQIGDPALHFGKPLAVTWRLNKFQRYVMEQLRGSVVQFDPDSTTWLPLDQAQLENGIIRVGLDRGGLLGVVAHVQYDDDPACV